MFRLRTRKVSSLIKLLCNNDTVNVLHNILHLLVSSYLLMSLENKLQMVVFLFPTQRKSLYSALKKVCCIHKPVPIQCVLVRTLQNQNIVHFMTMKIAHQIMCKLGGALWTVKFPCKAWMIVGIDVYHSHVIKSKPTVCAFISSLGDDYTKWYSSVAFQEREISDHLKMSMIRALEKFRSMYGNFPTKIVVFRNGVGNEGLAYARDYEALQFTNAVLDLNLRDITICMIVVQKCVSTRILALADDKRVVNQSPGTVVDTVITKKFLYDYYLKSQNHGSVSPTHYIVVSDNTGIKPDHIQKLSYKLCHLYYNWSGTIRVPAPCQYAHKLAYLVGEHVEGIPSDVLNDRLYYL